MDYNDPEAMEKHNELFEDAMDKVFEFLDYDGSDIGLAEVLEKLSYVTDSKIAQKLIRKASKYLNG